MGDVNRAFELLSGCSRDELEAMDGFTSMTPSEWLETERTNPAELQRTARPVRYEKEYLRKDAPGPRRGP